jgi:hypothetical protein
LRLNQSYLAPFDTPEHQQRVHHHPALLMDSAHKSLAIDLRTHRVLLGQTNLLPKFHHQ